ncbi:MULTISPECIES: hypothetical protein [unclassified Tolypothrix]|nr:MULTISPECIES: hypothetical protein [unclassified Tolypothrix]EKF02366.1 hypothetical protein FDUTEX481_07090 [Tolypothrix sp. PCC 7601]MBE9082357.1 hypothetical protein [Tolypothrix sp. LEGE 11397]UYD30256.1 hypothetical protein HGR01_13660 [Tolypothrix sp. PCC 7712]UYD35103.1 hypothetical protein HG267_04685 [Tolypothrix sp. PCC 7601]
MQLLVTGKYDNLLLVVVRSQKPFLTLQKLFPTLHLLFFILHLLFWRS